MCLSAQTFPGHEPDLGKAFRAIEWELRKSAERFLIGEVDPDAAVAAVVQGFRKAGVPAVRGELVGDAVEVEIAVPRGFG